MEKNIVENIERRYNMIGRSEKIMLNSILERPWRKIVIDKVVREEDTPNTHGSLVTELEQVKEETDRFFKKQFRKRQHLFAQLPEDWRNEYALKEWISREWYKKIITLIQEEEWEENLKLVKKGTAPGMSEISYTMLQKAGPKATRRFLKLVNIVLKYSIFPRRWKVRQIFSIPKMSEWDFFLASTRPIMLLETFQKSLVRIVQK